MTLRLSAWVAAVLILFVLGGCERPLPPAEDQSVRPAKLFRVSAAGDSMGLSFVGELAAMQTVDVSFEVPGEIQQLPVREGGPVSRGELVAALDPTDFELAVREAQVQLRLATQDLARKRSLLSERGISRALVDQAQAQFELSQVRLAQARKRLADSRILAPFDAFVAQRFVDNRSKVRVGEPVARLSDLSRLKVVTNVREELVATVTAERVLRVWARFDFLPERTFALTFLERSGEASDVAQTYEVAFTMEPPADVVLLPGMTAQIELELLAGTQVGQVIIPVTALSGGADGAFYVWVFDADTGFVERRSVQVGLPRQQGIAVLAGLVPGELIVAAGASQLTEGMRVHPLGEPETRLQR